MVRVKQWLVCPNCGQGRYTRWRRYCYAHVWRVRLVRLIDLLPQRVAYLNDELRVAYREGADVHHHP